MELSVFFGCSIACALGWVLVGLIETGLGGVGGLWVLVLLGVGSASADTLTYWSGTANVYTGIDNPGVGYFGPDNSADAAWFAQNNGLSYQFDSGTGLWILTSQSAGGASPSGVGFMSPTPAGQPAAFPGRGPLPYQIGGGGGGGGSGGVQLVDWLSQSQAHQDLYLLYGALNGNGNVLNSILQAQQGAAAVAAGGWYSTSNQLSGLLASLAPGGSVVGGLSGVSNAVSGLVPLLESLGVGVSTLTSNVYDTATRAFNDFRAAGVFVTDQSFSGQVLGSVTNTNGAVATVYAHTYSPGEMLYGIMTNGQSLTGTNFDGSAKYAPGSWAAQMLEAATNSTRSVKMRGPLISDTNSPSGKREMEADVTVDDGGINAQTVGQAQGEAASNSLTTQFSATVGAVSVPAGSAPLSVTLWGMTFDFDFISRFSGAFFALRAFILAFCTFLFARYVVTDVIKLVAEVGASGQLTAPDVQLAGFSVGKLLGPIYVAALLGGLAAIPLAVATIVGGGSPFDALSNTWSTLWDFGGISNTQYGAYFWYYVNGALPINGLALLASSSVLWLMFRGSASAGLMILQKMMVA